MVITNSDASLQQQKDKIVSDNSLSFMIPAGTIFTLTGFPEKQHVVIPGNNPEPTEQIVHWHAE